MPRRPVPANVSGDAEALRDDQCNSVYIGVTNIKALCDRMLPIRIRDHSLNGVRARRDSPQLERPVFLDLIVWAKSHRVTFDCASPRRDEDHRMYHMLRIDDGVDDPPS